VQEFLWIEICVLIVSYLPGLQRIINVKPPVLSFISIMFAVHCNVFTVPKTPSLLIFNTLTTHFYFQRRSKLQTNQKPHQSSFVSSQKLIRTVAIKPNNVYGTSA
jgi:hypothetical protein